MVFAETGPHRAEMPGPKAEEPYDGEDEFHPEGLLHIRGSSGARGRAARPGIARNGCTMRAGRTSAREDLPRSTPVICFADTATHRTEQPVAVAVGCCTDRVPSAVPSLVTTTGRPARACSGAADAGPRVIGGPGHRFPAGHRGRSDTRRCPHRLAGSVGCEPECHPLGRAGAGRRGRPAIFRARGAEQPCRRIAAGARGRPFGPFRGARPPPGSPALKRPPNRHS